MKKILIHLYLLFLSLAVYGQSYEVIKHPTADTAAGGAVTTSTAHYTDAEVTALLASGYLPIANAEDLKCIDTNYVTGNPRTWAAGTAWEVSDTSDGLNGFYLQVQDISLDSATLQDAYGSTWYDNTVGWEGIGTYNTGDFEGIYDGGNYQLDSLWINRGAATFVGLFDAVENGTIRNIRMDSVDVTSTKTGGAYIGGLMGALRGDTVENVRVTGTVTAAGDYIGGVIGYQATNTTILDRISFVGDVSGDDNIGGFMGFQTGNYLVLANNIYVQGTVTGDDEVGGLFGQIRFQNTGASNYSYVKNSYSTATVTGNTNVGNLAGDNTSNYWYNCYYDTTGNGILESYASLSPYPMPMAVMKGATGHSQEVSDSNIYVGWSGYVWNFGTGSDYPTFNDIAISGNAPSDFMSTWDKENENPLIEEIYSDNELYPVGAILYEGVADTAVYLLGKSGNQRLKAVVSADGFADWDTIAASAIGEVLNINNLPGSMGTATKFEYNTWRKIDSFYIFHGVRLNTGSYGVGYSTSDSIDDAYTIHDWLINPDTNNLSSTLNLVSINQIHAPELIRVDNTYHWYGTAEIGDEFTTYIMWHGTSPSTDLLNITFDQVIYNGADIDFLLSDNVAQKPAQILQAPRVYYDDSYYYMTFTVGGDRTVGGQRAIYVARSTTPTGFNLTNLQRTPIVTTNGTNTWNEQRVYTHDILKTNDGYWTTPHTVNDSIRMYFSGHSLSGSSYTPQNTGIPGLARMLDE